MDATKLGTATIQPTGAFPVSHTGTWILAYTVGTFGIDDGGSMIITRRAMSDATIPQCDFPGNPGYTTASTTGPAKLQVSYDNRYWIRPYRGAIVVRIYDGSLAPGDRITVTLGDTRDGSPGWTLQTFPETDHTFRVLVDSFGTREYYPLATHPSITIVPGTAARLDAVLPSTVRPGQEAPLCIRVLDAWDNPLNDFKGEITVHVDPPDTGWSRVFCLKQGVQHAGPLCFSEEGTYRLSLTSGDLSGVSNPMTVSNNVRPLCWGDMHGQTEDTVGTGSVEEYFRFARDKALMNVTSWQGNDFQVTDETWREVCTQTKRFYEPGRFVTFLGYEWSGLTPAGGDHNILYLKDDQFIHRSSHWQIHDGSSEATDRYPISALWVTFRGRDDVLAIAHVGGRYANLDNYDPELMRLVEIHSHHGTFEWLAEDALRRGYIVGFVGQSDDHSGRPGLSAPLRPRSRDFATFDVYGGYTAILAPELTREVIWKALRARHCYATSGRRILLSVSSGLYSMGDVIEEPHPVDLAVRVAGTAPLLDVEIRRNDQILHRYPFPCDQGTSWIRIEWGGVRIRSRAKKTDWNGTLTIQNGTIRSFLPFAFDQKGEGVRQISESALTIRSTTSGDIDGLFLQIDGTSPCLLFHTLPIRQEIRIADLQPTIPRTFDAGGVNQRLSVFRCSPENRPMDIAFAFRDPEPPPGPHAYWVKVVQIDGHMAWSSPMFFRHPVV